MRTPSRASAWVWAASSVILSGEAAAQATPQTRDPLPQSVQSVPGHDNAPRSSGGRNQFIAPVMNMQIQGEGLTLPTGVAQPEQTIKPPAAPAPAEKPTGK